MTASVSGNFTIHQHPSSHSSPSSSQHHTTPHGTTPASLSISVLAQPVSPLCYHVLTRAIISQTSSSPPSCRYLGGCGRSGSQALPHKTPWRNKVAVRPRPPYIPNSPPTIHPPRRLLDILPAPPSLPHPPPLPPPPPPLLPTCRDGSS